MNRDHREDVLSGKTVKLHTGCGGIYVVINSSHNTPLEVLISMGKAGGCAASQLEAIGRLISLALQAGILMVDIVDQLRYIRCPSPCFNNGNKILSCADAVAQALQKFDILPADYFQSPKEDPESKEK